MPSRHVDTQLKAKYELAFLKRNYWNKLKNCIEWGMDEDDIQLIHEAWAIKAHALGKEGSKRWADIEKERPDRIRAYMKSFGIAWHQDRSYELKKIGFTMRDEK